MLDSVKTEIEITQGITQAEVSFMFKFDEDQIQSALESDLYVLICTPFRLI